jgi:hypothetical protein
MIEWVGLYSTKAIFLQVVPESIELMLLQAMSRKLATSKVIQSGLRIRNILPPYLTVVCCSLGGRYAGYNAES